MNNLICNRCYNKDICYKSILNKNTNYICKLCNENIFFYTDYLIKDTSKKEIVFKKYNNNNECCLKECGGSVEEFEKTTILICCKCILEKKILNINNYNVVKPGKMCILCNYSFCSEYNFHNKCYTTLIKHLKETN